jgi:hypothetical protein
MPTDKEKELTERIRTLQTKVHNQEIALKNAENESDTLHRLAQLTLGELQKGMELASDATEERETSACLRSAVALAEKIRDITEFYR